MQTHRSGAESRLSPASADEGVRPEDSTGNRTWVHRFALNERGRDFVVGDIHGMFGALRELLRSAEFDDEVDRLFSVGDLIDRGPDSKEALTWLAFPWFHACRGNHEQFAIDSLDPEQLERWVSENGGEWWLQLDAAEQERSRHAFLRMPLAMEVETASGRVGIVHADVPSAMSWTEFTDLLEAGDSEVVTYALWSRDRLLGGGSLQGVVTAIDRVYCGHTPTREAVSLGNVHYIDTAAVYSLEGYGDARLTMIEIQPGPHRPYSVSTFGKTPNAR